MKLRFENIAGVVNARLAALFDGSIVDDEMDLYFPLPQNVLLDEVKALTLRGGKRIRAVLMAAAYELFLPHALQNDALLDCALAMELLQSYFLIHDDIMDDDAERRGGPSVHVSLTARLNSADAGRNQAVLAGDLACALHEGLLAGLSVDPLVKATVQQIFSRMHLDVVLGQSLDMLGEAAPEEIVKRKTASYTTIAPMCTGAALAGADRSQLGAVARLATPLGIAFQYRDDYIGVFGAHQALGKPVGSDVKNNKRTGLMMDALAACNAAQRAVLERALGNRDATDAELNDAVGVIAECGAAKRCEENIDALSRQVTTRLSALDARADGKAFVEWLVGQMAGRTF